MFINFNVYSLFISFICKVFRSDNFSFPPWYIVYTSTWATLGFLISDIFNVLQVPSQPQCMHTGFRWCTEKYGNSTFWTLVFGQGRATYINAFT